MVTGDYMKYFSMLIKPASSLCNLKCKYCFYHDVASNRETYCYDVLSDETIENIVNKTVGYFKEPAQISFAFQGGEPTCAGIEVFKKFINKVNEVKKDVHDIHYSIQTNGTLINDEWIEFFKEHHFLVGISLDGYQSNHDLVREDRNNQGTYDRIMKTIEQLKKNEIDFNVLTVLTSSLSNHAKELYKFYQEQDLSYIQLIPCLSDFNHESEYGLKPKEFFNFYNEFFDLWFEEYRKGIYRSVTFFDNIIPMFAGIPPQQCGAMGFCSMQFVAESNGDVYPCDFYVLDQYKIGNINQDTIVELAKSKITQEFIQEKRVLSNQCNSCPYNKMCRGNCKRMSGVYFDQEYCGIKEFLEAKEKQIVAIAQTL